MNRIFAAAVATLLAGCAVGVEPPELTGMVRVDGTDPYWYGPLEPCVQDTYGSALCNVEVWKDMEKANAHPPLRLKIDTFWLDAHEVTNAQYKFCVQMGQCSRPKADNGASTALGEQYYNNADGKFDNHPVTQVTREQAELYCAWLGKRLPTEFEWERAAKGPGDTRRIWPAELLGDSVEDCRDPALNLPAIACGRLADAEEVPVPGANRTYALTDNPTIKDYVLEGGQPIYHMFGNVSEWTSSRYRPGNTCLTPLPNECDPTWNKETLTTINRCLGSCNVVGNGCDDWGNTWDPNAAPIPPATTNTCNPSNLFADDKPGPEDSACYYRCTGGAEDDVLAPVCGYNPGTKVHTPDELLSATTSEFFAIKGGAADVPTNSLCALMSSASDLDVRKSISAKDPARDPYVGFRCALDGAAQPPATYPSLTIGDILEDGPP